MADDEPDWFGGGDDDAPAAAADTAPAAAGAAPAAASAAPGEPEPAAAEAAPVEETREVAEEEFLDPDKLLLCRHWIRPKFLQYKYLYDYRHNYYDDVIDYLDKRQHGLTRDIPVAQTWAERALRTYSSKTNRREMLQRRMEDDQLVERTKYSGALFRYHSKEYINRRYSKLLY